jgi:hypothetical protein
MKKQLAIYLDHADRGEYCERVTTAVMHALASGWTALAEKNYHFLLLLKKSYVGAGVQGDSGGASK